MSTLRRSSTPCITPNMRRSVTLPFLTDSRRGSLPRAFSRDSSPDPKIETLFCHPSARIISFNAIAPDAQLASSKGRSEDAPGSLSWTSRTERTIAVGPLRIYRTPNSVIFLNCGADFVRPVFPKSKCWCVEEASGKFVLEMRKPQYWRIEVPNENDEDISMMDQLKEVFSQILLYEKTSCPFQRNFDVELPPEADMPIKYKPWTPRPSIKATEFDSPDLFSLSISEEIENEKSLEHAISDDNLSTSSHRSRESDSNSDVTAATEVSPRREVTKPAALNFGSRISNARSVTAPPQLTLLTSPPSKKRGKSPLGNSVSSSSSGSFHSIRSWHSPIEALPPSPPALTTLSPTTFRKLSLPYPTTRSSTGEHHDPCSVTPPIISDRQFSSSALTTIELQQPMPANLTLQSSGSQSSLQKEESTSDDEFQDFHPYDSSPPSGLKIIENHFGLPPRPSSSAAALPTTPLAPTFENAGNGLDEFSLQPPPPGRRGGPSGPIATTSSRSARRALSPLPPAINLFSPTHARRPRHLQTAKHLPTAILQKTYEILLSPPSHLVSLMLEWAARLAAGGWWSGRNEFDNATYESWGLDEFGGEDRGWGPNEGELDDYGMVVVPKLRYRESSANVRGEARRRVGRGRSWEVD